MMKAKRKRTVEDSFNAWWLRNRPRYLEDAVFQDSPRLGAHRSLQRISAWHSAPEGEAMTMEDNPVSGSDTPKKITRAMSLRMEGNETFRRREMHEAADYIERIERELSQARAALKLVKTIHAIEVMHLGRTRISGIEKRCIYCIASIALGESADTATAEDFDAARKLAEGAK